MKGLITVLSAIVGTTGFALMFRVPKKRLPFAALGGGLSCAVYVLMAAVCPFEFLQFLVAAIVATAYAEIFARIIKTPSSTLLTPAIIPLVPGGTLYYSMSYAVAGDMTSFYKAAYLTIEMAGGIAAGIMFVSALFYSISSHKQKRLQKETTTQK